MQWDDRSRDLPIAVKELIPILVACVVWGATWQDHQVTCHCDNQVVVACLSSGTSKHALIMHMLRCLVFVEAYHRFHIKPVYINTLHSHLVDDLSRDRLSSFLSKVPQANRGPTPVPPPLLDLLLNTAADWLSPTWCHRFSAIFTTA